MEWELHREFDVLHCGLFLADAQFVDNFGDSLPIRDVGLDSFRAASIVGCI